MVQVRVNPYYLSSILLPFSSIGGEEEMALLDIDFQDECQAKCAFGKYVQPVFESLDQESKKRVWDSMRYYLSRNQMDLERVFQSCMDSAVQEPVNPRQFYGWLWDVLFPGTDIDGGGLESVVEEDDLNLAVLRRKC